MKGHTIAEKIRACRLLNKLEVDGPLGDNRKAIQKKYCYGKAIISRLVRFGYLDECDRERFCDFYEYYLKTQKTRLLIDFLKKARKSIYDH